MASADQLKALLQSHLEGDETRFYSVAMQVAAHEAKRGHGKLAEDLRTLVDQAKTRRAVRPDSSAVPISKPRGELANLLSVSYPKSRMGDHIGSPLRDIIGPAGTSNSLSVSFGMAQNSWSIPPRTSRLCFR